MALEWNSPKAGASLLPLLLLKHPLLSSPRKACSAINLLLINLFFTLHWSRSATGDKRVECCSHVVIGSIVKINYIHMFINI